MNKYIFAKGAEIEKKYSPIDKFYKNIAIIRKPKPCKKCNIIPEDNYVLIGEDLLGNYRYEYRCQKCGRASKLFTYEQMLRGEMEKEWNKKN